jgi:hypothetical protein
MMVTFLYLHDQAMMKHMLSMMSYNQCGCNTRPKIINSSNWAFINWSIHHKLILKKLKT